MSPLGAGGMGEVYKARDTRLDRTVAIKVLAPEIAGALDKAHRAGITHRDLKPANIILTDVTPDGECFLVNVTTEESTTPPIIVVLNWQSGLAARETR